MKEKILIRETKNGEQTTWYSKEYVEDLLTDALEAGFIRGVRITIHAINPISDDTVDSLSFKIVTGFKERIKDEIFNYYTEVRNRIPTDLQDPFANYTNRINYYGEE